MAKAPSHIAEPAPKETKVTFVSDSGISAGSAFVPDSPTVANQITRVEPIPAYQLKAHPERWTVMRGELVPLLGKIKHIRGLNGADGEPGKPARIATAEAGAREAGWTPIPFTAVPTSAGVSSYLWRPEGRPDVHLHFTERVYPGSARVEADEPRYVEWCRWLVTSGTISPPAPYVLRTMEAEYDRRYNDALNRSADFPSYKDVADRALKDLEAIRAELAKVESAPSKPDTAFVGAP
ncbi:hypothetical protein [Janthinobacterium sp.]|uniref:hypothetical protein n=1 Tax=Janthinobacterium sp. TaxID=1871054 RepID=UPI0025BD1E3B|nr:hypothetical protein [Janthinobacterium sp.]NBV19954.1 hypothetical protein [Janthinobacterium sp.]